jgi:hypothetical protein
LSERDDVFIYRNLKSLLYIFLATASICGAAFQLSNFYLSKQDIPDSQNIVGYLITEGEQVIVKKAQAHAGTLAIHGQILLSNDTIKTLEASVVIEVGQHKLRILPYSDVNVKKNGDKFEFYLSSGSVIALTKKADKVVTLFEQNNGQFAQLPLLGPTIENKNALFQVKDISLIADSNGPQLQFKWAADSEIKNRWVEFYAGHDKSHLQLVKAYPFETGGFKEVWSMPQFYWQVIVKENDAAVETSPVTFWKNEFQSKINLIYPADKEVINNVLNPEDFILRWSKAANVGRVKVQVFRNNVMETELNAGLKNQVQFKPAQYGFYYWRVLNDHGVFTEPRSFFYAPLASVDSDVLSWSEGVEPKQFYYRDSIMHLKWQKMTKLPVAKYKITLIYIQESKDGDVKQVKENLFVDGEEVNIRLDASTPIKVRVEPYNNKMQILGKALNQEVTLVKRTGKQQPLVLTNHEKTKKNEVITDRNYSLNFDKSSMSPLYEYPYEVIGADKKVVKTGVITKGQSLSLKGLPIDYYQVKMRIEDKKLKNLIESQNLATKDAKSRLPASQNQVIEQGFAVKLIPPTDFNTSQSGVITPQVENVEISN